MKEAEALRQAISVISGQRLLLGDRVAVVTVAALQAKLAAVEDGKETAVSLPDRAAQRKYLTILFAQVSGFTAATQILPNTQMLNLINLLWRRLDGVITAHGGMVDKHMGDAVMGLFGVPVAGEDDSERAVRAALEMRSVLAQFTAEMRAEFAAYPALDTGGTGVLAALDALHLRVGINTGPVLVGEIGAGNEYTVIGDAVNVASRLEQKAPRDSILISHETYQLVRGAFDMEPLGPMHLKGKQEPIPVYLVSGVKSRIFSERGRGVEGVETEMVGRDKELLFLQTSLRDVIKSGKGKVITVVGEAGIGKSRLIHEYHRWVKGLPVKVNVLRGHTEPSMKHLPYSLARDLFVTFFSIQDNDPASVVKTKINQQMERYFPQDTPEKLQQRCRAFAQLLGLNMEDDLDLSLLTPEMPQAREETFKDLARLLRQAVADYRAGLLILEDMHWADEGSLELIDYLAELCRDTPLLILCITRSSLLDYHATWGLAENGAAHLGREPILQETVVLKMLPAPQCRQLVENILRYLPEIPPALSDLIVHRSEGNPFYVEELVKVLIEDGVIVPGESSWRVLKKELTDVRIPLTLTGVLQARLDRLSSLERVTLQRAAVIGRVFWDSTVMVMNGAAEETAVHAPETITALQALERREMIFQRNSSMFTGSSAYLFKHEMLREVAYESVLLRMRPAYHKQVADWLVQESGERVAEYAGLIADHYEKAEQWLPAAEMYERAAVRAQELSNPELALTHFKKVFALIEPEPHQNAWKVSVLEQIAQLLHLQARLVEAADTLNLMRQAAELDGDLLAQTKALGALSRIQYEQQLYEAARQAVDKAEQIAWLVGDDLELVRILLTKSVVYRHLSDPIQAAQPGQQALGVAERLGSSEMILVCLKTLTLLAIDAGRQAHVEHYIGRLQALINRLDQAKIELATIGAGFVALGEIYNRLGRYDKVARPLLLAVRIFKKLDDQQGAAQALDLLGDSGRLRGDNDQAAPFYREALAIASATGDVVGEMWYRVHLAASRCGLAQYALAEKEILRVLQLAEDRARFEHWQGLSFAYGQLTTALLGLNRGVEALDAAQKALAHAAILADDRLVGSAWYALGLAAVGLPQTALPVSVNDKTYMPGDCFNESLRLLRRANGDSTGAFREQALVLWAWAQYESSLGNRQRSQILRYEARAVADEIGLSLGA